MKPAIQYTMEVTIDLRREREFTYNNVTYSFKDLPPHIEAVTIRIPL